MDLLGELETRVVCGDGAMGTLLLAGGVPLERCFEELCVSELDRIQRIHEDYIAAGARVIKTNTFGANAARLERFGFQKRVGEINRAAVEVAKTAAQPSNVFIAGSVGPLGITADEAEARGLDRKKCFREQIAALVAAGVDLIFFETFTDFAEMEVALLAKNEVGGAPEICSFACRSDGRLRCGTMLTDAFAKLHDAGATMMGVNCMNDPREMAALVQLVSPACPFAVYPTAGQPRRNNGGATYDVSPKMFAASARELMTKGARLLGGCCGTTPKHIAALDAAIHDFESR
jgi:methionine synthase / methylenetetrahydrofolate reductase(NADPH)